MPFTVDWYSWYVTFDPPAEFFVIFCHSKVRGEWTEPTKLQTAKMLGSSTRLWKSKDIRIYTHILVLDITHIDINIHNMYIYIYWSTLYITRVMLEGTEHAAWHCKDIQEKRLTKQFRWNDRQKWLIGQCQTFYLQGTLGFTPNVRVPMVFIVFSRDSCGS